MSEREQCIPIADKMSRAEDVMALHPGIAVERQELDSLLIMKGSEDGCGVAHSIHALAVWNPAEQQMPDLALHVTQAGGRPEGTTLLAEFDGETYRNLQHIEGPAVDVSKVIEHALKGAELFAAYAQLPQQVQNEVPSGKVFDLVAVPVSGDADPLLAFLQGSLEELSAHHAQQPS